jgi:TonB family protein
MKKIFLLFILFASTVFAQESNDKIIYLDSLNREATKENHYYYKVIKEYSQEKSEYRFLTYFKSGTIYQEGYTTTKDGNELVGEIISYSKNGNKVNSTIFQNGRPMGKVQKWYESGIKSEEGEFLDLEWSTGKSYKVYQFWDENNTQKVIDGNGVYTKTNNYITETGSLKNGYKDGIWKGESIKKFYSFVETYKEGDFISGVSTEYDGTKYKYTELEVKPEPKKGLQHFYKYIAKNFTYTRASIKNKIKGKIIVQFVVDSEGKIVEPKIIKGLGYGLDEEAIRVLTSYDKWIPALQRGRKVRCSYSIPISLSTE